MTKQEFINSVRSSKIYVNGKFKELQEKLFELGAMWNGDKVSKFYEYDAPFIFINDNLKITHSNRMSSFVNDPGKEVSADYVLSTKYDDYKIGDYIVKKTGAICILRDSHETQDVFYMYHHESLSELIDYSLPNQIERLATEKEIEKHTKYWKSQGKIWNPKALMIEDYNWTPEHGEIFYSINYKGSVNHRVYVHHSDQKSDINLGNYFKTKSAAKKASLEIMELFKKLPKY